MQYSPKLKKAMEEIKVILHKYDIGGICVLHTVEKTTATEEEGMSYCFTEFLNKLDPSYSCITINGDHVRFKSSLADFNGDKKAQMKKTTETLNLLESVTEVGGMTLLPLFDLAERLQKDLDSEKGRGGGFTSHTTQNN